MHGMRKLGWVWPLVAGGLWGTGCAAESSGIDLAAQALCERLHECADDYGFHYDSVESCQERMACQVDPRLEQTSDACRKALAERSCSELVTAGLPAPCSALGGGKVVARKGETCDRLTKCERNTFCERPQGSTGSSCGVCAGPRSLGSNCIASWECESHYCDDEDRCATPDRVGEPCTSTGACRGFCDTKGICRNEKTDGAACTDHLECESDLCLDNTCQRYSAPKLGDACERSCATLACVDGRCVEPPRWGEPCVKQCAGDVCCGNDAICVEGYCEPLPACGTDEVDDLQPQPELCPERP